MLCRRVRRDCQERLLRQHRRREGRRGENGLAPWTMQWMSKNPADAPDHVFGCKSGVGGVRMANTKQQAKGWVDVFGLRSRELRLGGRLVSIFTGSTPERVGWDYVGGELWQAVLDINRDGLIGWEEALRITIPTADRSLEAVRAPFQETDRFAGLELEHAD